MRVLVVIPTYNEVENIAVMVPKVRAIVPDASILVVDDNSPDGTADLVATMSESDPSVAVLRRPGKAGLGRAYRAGFRWGIDHGFDAMVEMDADFSHDPSALPTLLAAADRGADLVIGSRYVEGGSIPNWSWHRHLLSRGGNLYASLMLRLKVKDATAGFRVYRSSALEKMEFESVEADGYGFQVEMTLRAREIDATIVEVPISFIDREVGESKMSTAIVVEALDLVTRRGVARLIAKIKS